MYMCVSMWILLLDWLARGMYTLVLCAEMEVRKSAISHFCRDAGIVVISALWEPKTVNPGIRAKKTEIPALMLVFYGV